MNLTGRHEYKHYISIADYYTVKSKLSALMKRDPNSNAEGKYFIRSLYFDNDCDKILMEKMNGLDNRDKFRIRTYNHSENIINLEKKSKKSGRCFKVSTRLTKEECQSIIAGDITWMKESSSELVRELYINMEVYRLQAKTIVDYEREAYIYEPGNVRITFDANVRTGMYSTELFNKELLTFPANGDMNTILEVKYDNYFPETISNIVQLGNRRNLSVSKYMLCRIYG